MLLGSGSMTSECEVCLPTLRHSGQSEYLSRICVKTEMRPNVRSTWPVLDASIRWESSGKLCVSSAVGKAVILECVESGENVEGKMPVRRGLQSC